MKKTLIVPFVIFLLLFGISQAALVDEAVSWAYTNNMTIHKTSKDFKVDQNIRRDEAAKFFVNFAKLVGKNIYVKTDSECKFSDIDQSWSDLRNVVVESCKLGIFKGTNGRFNPQGSLTNAESVTVLMRIINGYQVEDYPDWSARYYDKANEWVLLKNIDVTNKTNSVSRGTLITLLYNAREKKGLNYIHSENSLLKGISFKRFDKSQEFDSLKTSLEEEANTFESLLDIYAKNNSINKDVVNKYNIIDKYTEDESVVIVPWTNFYNRAYTEYVYRSKNFGDSPIFYGEDQSSFIRKTLNSLRKVHWNSACEIGLSIDHLQNLLDNKSVVTHGIRYKNGIIGYGDLSNGLSFVGPRFSCSTDVVAFLAWGMFYETYDKNNYYLIPLSSYDDYLLDFEQLSFFEDGTIPVEDYYKGWIIGTQKKTNGMYPRLKYIGEAHQISTGSFSNDPYFAKGDIIGKYVEDLFSGKEKSKYFDETLERYKKKIDALYQ